MKKRSMKCIMSIAVVLMVLIGVMLWKIVENVKKNPAGSETDIVSCVERTLGIEFGKGIALVEGKYLDEEGEEHIDAKFSVEEKYLNNLKETLIEIMRTPEEDFPSNIERDDIWLDLKESEIVEYYTRMQEGKKAKTIIVDIFIATNQTGEYYLYVFY